MSNLEFARQAARARPHYWVDATCVQIAQLALGADIKQINNAAQWFKLWRWVTNERMGQLRRETQPGGELYGKSADESV